MDFNGFSPPLSFLLLCQIITLIYQLVIPALLVDPGLRLLFGFFLKVPERIGGIWIPLPGYD